MAPIVIGIDLGQSPFRVGGLVIGKYSVIQGSKEIKVNGDQAPDRRQVVEVFQDANQVVKSFFGSSNFEAAVVAVPNSTSFGNQEAVADAARGAHFNIVQVVKEYTAVAAAYAEKVKASSSKRHLAIISITGGVLDISIIIIRSDLEFELVAEDTHPSPIEFEESKQSGPGGLLGHVGGLIGGAVKALVVDPLEKFVDVIKTLMSSPKLGEFPVDEVVFVGKASKSEKLKQAAKERFANARVWSLEDFGDEELVAYGAAVIAYKRKPAYTYELQMKSSANDEDFNIHVAEELRHVEEVLAGKSK